MLFYPVHACIYIHACMHAVTGNIIVQLYDVSTICYYCGMCVTYSVRSYTACI